MRWDALMNEQDRIEHIVSRAAERMELERNVVAFAATGSVYTEYTLGDAGLRVRIEYLGDVRPSRGPYAQMCIAPGEHTVAQVVRHLRTIADERLVRASRRVRHLRRRETAAHNEWLDSNLDRTIGAEWMRLVDEREKAEAKYAAVEDKVHAEMQSRASG